MSCKENLLPITIVLFILALVGYLIISIFVVPVQAECSNMNDIPEEAVVDLSMGDWIYSNMIAGIILFSILSSLAKGSKGDSTCLVVVFIIFSALYCLFEIVWGIIGIILFYQTYQDACSYSDSFNSYVTAELAYGMILFPSIVICAIALAIISTRKEKGNTGVAGDVPALSEPILGGEPTPESSQPVPDRSSNVYQTIYSRLSGSFADSNDGRIN